MPPLHMATAPSTVKLRNSTNFQAASWRLLCFGMTHRVPPHWPVSLGADLPHSGHGMRPIFPDSSGACFFRTMAEGTRSEEHTSELQSRLHLVCRLLLEKK